MDFILQAENRGRVRFSVSCRESMVRNRFLLVGEYPSGCLAADKTTFRLNNIWQAVFFLPDSKAIDAGVDGGPAGFAIEGFRKHVVNIRVW